MCDNDQLDDMNEYELRNGLSRRQFGAMTLAASFAMMPMLAGAAETTGADIEIKTSDGTCDAYFVHPAKGKHPGVLIWPDIYGLRPAMKQMATLLSEAGYSVLVVNPFYRIQKAPTSPENADFNDPETRKLLSGMSATMTPETAMVDAKAFVAYLDSQKSVDKKRKIGTQGYCMGGPLIMRTAAFVPERIGAAASFHGGNLVNDKPISPHLLIPQMKAQLLIAIAENDDQKQPDAKDVLRESFAKANIPAEIEVYAGTLHGWCPTDSRVYNADQAEKAWGRLLALYGKALA
jgi:carboxymethylenebutenolidase